MAEYLVDLAMHQLGCMFCFYHIVEDLGKQKKILANDVERERRYSEEIEDDVQIWLEDANRILVVDVENEIEESEKCSDWPPSRGCRYQLLRKLAKRTLALIEHQTTCKFERVGHLSSLQGIGFFLSRYFIPFNSSILGFDQIIEALKNDDVSMVGLHGMGGVGKTTLVKKESGCLHNELLLFLLIGQ